MKRRYVLGAAAAIAVGVPAAVLSQGHSAPAAPHVTAASVCPYVADGGYSLALVTVATAGGPCSAFDLESVHPGAFSSYKGKFYLYPAAQDASSYAYVAGSAATSPAACRVDFPRGVVITVYSSSLNAVQPMVCAALHNVPAY